MKTPEEIKNDLKIMSSNWRGWSVEAVANIALAYIEQLEEQITLMKLQMKGDCGVCKHRNDERKLEDKQFGCRLSPVCYECLKKDGREMWEYEGLPEVKNKLEVTRK